MDTNFTEAEQEECAFVMAQDKVLIKIAIDWAKPGEDNFITMDQFKFNL